MLTSDLSSCGYHRNHFQRKENAKTVTKRGNPVILDSDAWEGGRTYAISTLRLRSNNAKIRSINMISVMLSKKQRGLVRLSTVIRLDDPQYDIDQS